MEHLTLVQVFTAYCTSQFYRVKGSMKENLPRQAARETQAQAKLVDFALVIRHLQGQHAWEIVSGGRTNKYEWIRLLASSIPGITTENPMEER